MSDNILKLENVHKRFKKKEVLKGVNLDVNKGSVLGLLGKNASGKTTMIKSALGMLKIQEGMINIMGEDTWTLSAEKKSYIGYVPQKLELYVWMNIRQIIDYTASFYPHWNHELTNKYMLELELNESDKVGNLSGGQIQSIGLLLALGHEPELIILDEPAAGLDPSMRRLFLSIVLDVVKDQDRTVIFSTHLTGDLERVADQVAILKDGVIDYFGDLDKLKDEVKRLKVSARSALPDKLEIPGMLSIERNGSDALLSARGVTPEIIKQLELQLDADIEVRDMNLEDIFIEVHHG